MELRTRNHVPEDYPLFCQWWKDWGWDAIPEMYIPENSIVVIDEDDKPICAVFIYLTDTPIVWVENYISDKQVKSEKRRASMELLMNSLNDKIKGLGKTTMISAVKHNGLARRLEKIGCHRADENLTSYIGVVQ